MLGDEGGGDGVEAGRRTIAVVTSSRADYGHLYWVLRELGERPGVDLRLIALGAHLSPEFGRTLEQIEADGFVVDAAIECLISSDSDVGMAKTVGLATLSLADTLGAMRPDLLLLIADRYEMLAPASTALALRIPIAHIEGGEVSEGAIDNAVRNALTMMSHVHFTPTRQASARVLLMGEEPWRVHQAGAPSLDHLRRAELPSGAELLTRLELGSPDGLGLDSPIVVGYHPVTLARDTTGEADALYAALAALTEQGRQLLFCFPNSDAGSRRLIERAAAFCDASSRSRLYVNLDTPTYWALLRESALLLGNSSSGIMEAASLELPAVNVGARQQGRERAANVIDAPAETAQILAAVDRGLSGRFRASLVGLVNPYGDGHAAERIADVLATVEIGERLLVKRTRAAPRPVTAS